MALALVDIVVELGWNSNFVNYIISEFALVREIITVEVALSVGDREVRFSEELAVGNAQRDICPPDGARMPVMAPLVRSTALAWTPRRPALTQRPSILLLPLPCARSGGNAVAIAAESFASSSRPRLCISLRL